MTLKKRQPPRTQKSTGTEEMPNANDRLIELEGIIERWSKQLHQQSVEIERIKSRQQLQDQLNDDVGVTLANVEGEQNHLRALAMAASEDIGDLAGHEDSIQHIQSQVGILSAVLKKRFEDEKPDQVFTAVDTQDKKSFWSKAATVALYFGCGATGVYFSVATISAGHIAGWW